MKYVRMVDYLNENEKDVIDEWELRVRSEVSAAEGTASLVLRDHLVKLLDELKGYLYELSLGGEKSPRAGKYLKAAIEVLEFHGRERAATKNYSEDQVVREIVFLRRVVMEGLIKNEKVDTALAEDLTCFFEELYCAAVESFSRSIKHTQRKVISSLVHDIRNPLSTLDASSRILERKGVPDEASRLLSAMRYGVRRISAILTDVLDLANIEAGKGLNFSFQKCNFVEDLDVIKRESEMIYGERFKYEREPQKGEIQAVADPAMLVRLLENLISNGFKHGSSDGDVTLKVVDGEDDIVITVHNWGMPIPADKREEIFEYLSTTKGGNSEKKSWGIGLSLAKAIAEGHKGSVQVESTRETGTRFVLTIPKFARQPEETFTIVV